MRSSSEHSASSGYNYPAYSHAPHDSYDPYAYAHPPPAHTPGENPFTGGSSNDHNYSPTRHPAGEYSIDHGRQMSQSGHAPYGSQPNFGFPSSATLPGYAGTPQDEQGDVPLMAAGNGGGRYGYAPVELHDEGVHPLHTPQGYGGDVFGDGDETVEGTGRARFGRDSEASYMPGGFDPNMLEEGEAPPGIRYGRIPQRVPRRYKTLKRVELYHGNLVLDCPVPGKLLDKLNDRESREFTHMRYTAATCDPDNFRDERYTLRQVLFDPPRRTELFICMTMYNEDEELFTRTMHGVMSNIAHLCTRERSKTWGKEGWKKVVVCIVSDGRLKINSRTLSVLAAMGVYQEGVGKNVVNGKQVTAHIYE